MKTLSSVGMGLVALAFLSGAPSKALAQLTWDIAPGTVGVGDGTITGGAGNWNTTGTNGVWTSDGGVNNVAWVNNVTTPSSAIFGGAASGAVAVTTVNVQDITFDTTAGYILSGSTITLGDTTAGDQTNPTITANVDATINSLLAGNDGLVKAGGGNLTLGGNNTFTGATSVTGGTLAISTATLPSYNGNIAVSSGAMWSVNVTAGITLAGNISDAGTVLNNGSAFAYFNGAAGQFTSFTGTLQNTSGSSYLAFPAGAGAVNTKVQVNGGNFVIGANGSTTGTWQIGSLAGTGGAVYAAQGGSGTLVLETGALNADTSYSGTINNFITSGSAVLALTKVGTGKQTLTGNNTFAGNVVVNGGTLTTGTGNGISYLGSRTAPRTITVNSGTILELLGTYQLSTTGAAVPGSSITIDGGTLRNNSTISAQFDVLNNLTMRNGAILTANSSTYPANYQAFQLRGNVTVANTGGNTTASTIAGGTGTNRGLHLHTNTNFDVADVTGTTAADLTVSTELLNQNGDLLSAAGALTKSGAGRMDLTAFNTFTGGTTVDGGTLQLGVGSGTGAIRGTLTINAAGTVVTSAANAFGFTAGVKVNTVNINGGLLDNTAAGDQGWALTANLTGGTMRSNGGTSSASTTQLFSLGGGSAINSLASATTSAVQGRINLREGNASNRLVFTVDDGAAATDLLVSAAITQAAAGYGITKEGNGVMQISGANAYTGGTSVNGGTLTVSASQASATGAISVASGAFLRTTFTGYNTWGNPSPTMTIAGTLSADAASSNAHNLGTLNLNGGTLTSINGLAGPANDDNFGNWVLRNVIVAGSSMSNISSTTVQIAGGSFSFDVGNAVAGTDLLISSRITAGAITKVGTGTMRLTGANTNAGLTTITSGSLLVSNATGSGVGTNNVSINGGTLGGIGFVGTALDASNVSFTSLGGTVAPGESAGQLTVFGDVDFTSSGTKAFAVELNGLTVGTLYDQLVVNSATGGFNLINLANAALSVSLGFTPNVNDQFTILLNNTPAAITGNFFGLLNNSTFLVNTTTFRINYNAGTGNDVVLTVVPEPGAFALMLFGALTMFLFRGHRTRRLALA